MCDMTHSYVMHDLYKTDEYTFNESYQWLFFQNVIQVQPHGGKNPIVLCQEMWLQVFRHVSLQPTAATMQSSTGQVPLTELTKTIAIHRNTQVHLVCVAHPRTCITSWCDVMHDLYKSCKEGARCVYMTYISHAQKEHDVCTSKKPYILSKEP